MLAGYDVTKGLLNNKQKENTHLNYEHKSHYLSSFDKVLFEHALCVSTGLCPQKQTLKYKSKKDKRTTKKKLQ